MKPSSDTPPKVDGNIENDDPFAAFTEEEESDLDPGAPPVVILVEKFLIFQVLLVVPYIYFSWDDSFYFVFSPNAGIIALGLLSFCLSWMGFTSYQERKSDFNISVQVQASVEQHFDVLVNKRIQLCREDAYGNTIDAGWRKEMEYFAERVVAPLLSSTDARRLMGDPERHLFNIIGKTIEEKSIELAQSFQESGFSDQMSGTDYEVFCCKILLRQGWKARVTSASNDQGVDLVAEKDSFLLAIQCKRYSKPVGNSAVQEVVAGKGFYNLDHAIVVSSAGFTRSAKELASSHGVLLLHHSDLMDMEKVMGRFLPLYSTEYVSREE